MSINACLYADTKATRFFHWDFIIEESVDGWEWTHKDYAENGITGTCDTVFDAIEAVDEWRADAMPDEVA